MQLLSSSNTISLTKYFQNVPFVGEIEALLYMKLGLPAEEEMSSVDVTVETM